MTNEQKAKIIDLRRQGLGYVKIGQMLGISHNTVRSFCSRNAQEMDVVAVCKQCGAAISAGKYRGERKFCSVECRNKWWNAHLDQVNRKAYYTMTCQHCGQRFDSYGNKSRLFCSRKCYFDHRYERRDGNG